MQFLGLGQFGHVWKCVVNWSLRVLANVMSSFMCQRMPKVDSLASWFEVSDLRRSFVGWLKKAELETKQHRSDIRQERVVLYSNITSTSLNFNSLEMTIATTPGEMTC